MPVQIGFESEDSMGRGALTSGLVLSLLITLRVRVEKPMPHRRVQHVSAGETYAGC